MKRRNFLSGVGLTALLATVGLAQRVPKEPITVAKAFTRLERIAEDLATAGLIDQANIVIAAATKLLEGMTAAEFVGIKRKDKR